MTPKHNRTRRRRTAMEHRNRHYQMIGQIDMLSDQTMHLMIMMANRLHADNKARTVKPTARMQ